MHAGRFDTLTRDLAPRSRRRFFGILSGLGGLLIGSLGLLGVHTSEAGAKKKKPCPPCKKRKKGKCKANVPDGAACSGGTCQGGSCVPPSPPGPVTTADAACHSPHLNWSPYPRNAQTFRALRSGQLTSASVELHDNVEGADFDLEIWSVDAANAPSTVLAGTTIADVPATPPGPRTLTGTFAAPATVVAGLRYALVITGRVGQPSGIWVNSSDACPDGNWFYAPTLTGAFTAGPVTDLGFATFVTA